MNFDPRSPEKTTVQPESIHGSHSVAPIVAAIVGILVIAVTVAISLLFLPRIDYQRENNNQVMVPRENPTRVPNSMQKKEVVRAEERGAVCNDGSPGAYYFRPGTVEHANDWIVFLQGGGTCGSDEACAARADESPRYISSRNHPETLSPDGIFSPSASENPDFYNWNHVEVIYCSSDGWTGDGEATVAGEEWYFRGRDIVTAVIEDLQNPEIISTAPLGPGDRLIFSGSSAGGGGASKNIDLIASSLTDVEVKGFIDSSFGLNVESFAVPEEYQDITPASTIAFQSRLSDESCLADHEDDVTYCVNLDQLYPYIETPIFIFNNQLDRNRLGNHGITDFTDPAQREWIENTYLPAFLASIEDVNPIFSPRLTFHTLLTGERFFSTKIDGVSVAEAFANWYFERGGPTRYIEAPE